MNNINQLKKNSLAKIILFFENIIDLIVISKTNFKKGRDFETVAKKLKI